MMPLKWWRDHNVLTIVGISGVSRIIWFVAILMQLFLRNTLSSLFFLNVVWIHKISILGKNVPKGKHQNLCDFVLFGIPSVFLKVEVSLFFRKKPPFLRNIKSLLASKCTIIVMVKPNNWYNWFKSELSLFSKN